jgi:16S rRNA (uracil1498-N3)-methyltransferase
VKKETLAKVLQTSKSNLVLIGPEGDFTPSEVELALTSGFKPVSLGEARLRTETAGVMVAAMASTVAEL